MRRQTFVASTVAVLALAFAAFQVPEAPAQDAAAKDAEREIWRVLPKGEKPKDARLGKLRTLNDAYHPWTPPESKEAWEKEAQRLREQVQVGIGLWPMPEKGPLNAVVHGKIDRDDYTIEKVFFESHPGHYVTGNLYRPKNVTGKIPGVLCPHGHWPNGRMHEANDAAVKRELDSKAERHESGARYPVQARMVGLARLGCVVFHYDMVGYVDSDLMQHRQGFNDHQAGLRLHNPMGLQTWNSIRALDFLLTLPDVDPERLAVTGSSGGGTQTFMLTAVDPRPHVAFPAVMVGTGMQGGCVCENAPYLRIGINNIALAALFAPKPQAMSGADDWTIAIETKGLPELQQIYGYYGERDKVNAKAFPQFKHNYNGVAREMMYEWFNQHLNLGKESPIIERDFVPVPPQELTVWDDKHPKPANGKNAAELRKYLTQFDEERYAALLPKTIEDVAKYKEVVGTAARVMFGEVPDPASLPSDGKHRRAGSLGDWKVRYTLIGRRDDESIPVLLLGQTWSPDYKPGKPKVLWFGGTGKTAMFDEQGQAIPAVKKLVNAGINTISPDLFLTGEYTDDREPGSLDIREGFDGFAYGYNRPLLAHRVRDVLTLVAWLRGLSGREPIYLIGTGEAGPWVLLAAAIAGDKIDGAFVDLGGFGFGKIESIGDQNYLPGALKYGGIGGLAALAAPTELFIAGTKGVPENELAPLRQVYEAAGGKLTLQEGPLDVDKIVERLK
ncbi:MAG: acetylxylan esterase [Planctomycetaceae bacterium]